MNNRCNISFRCIIFTENTEQFRKSSMSNNDAVTLVSSTN